VVFSAAVHLCGDTMAAHHPSSAPTVIASQVAAVLEAGVRAGLDPGALLDASGLDAAALANPEGRVPFSAEVALWHMIERGFDGEAIGLQLAESAFEPNAFGAVGFAARTSANLGEALEIVARYCRVMNESTETRIVREGSIARLIDGPRRSGERWPRAKAEFVFGGYVLLTRRWMVREWVPHEIRFQHSAEVDTTRYADVFRCPIRFGQPRNELVFDSALLEVPLLHSDPKLLAYLRHRAEDLARGVEPDDDLAAMVRHVIRRELSNGVPEMSAVAQRLGIPSRTFQRKLTRLGTTFKALVDEARREAALRYLAQRGATENQVAFLTGFSDDRAFRRAFRRWTGVSPATWRVPGLASPVRPRGVRGPSR
jgi:AraC-like DNA-binding protein